MTALDTTPRDTLAPGTRDAHGMRPQTGAWSAGELAALAALLVLAVLAALPSWRNVASLAWRSAEYSHMLLVPAVALFLLWQRRGRLARTPRSPSLAGPAAALVGVALDFAGFATQIDLLKDVGMLALLLAPVLAVAGWRWPLSALPAFGALVFLIPVPGRLRQQIALPLQDVSAAITSFLLDIAGIPVARVGNVLQINGVDVAVAEACNGMRMVLALGLVAYAFVFSVSMRAWARVAILALTPAIAVAANVLRLGPTTLFYGYADRELADFAHDVSGWLVLAVALGLLWAVLAISRWLELPIEPKSPNTR